MDRGTRTFWTLTGTLFAAAIYFTVNAESRRREAQASVATLETGELVTFSRATDGDSIVVTRENGDAVAVRIVGVKAFDAQPDSDPAARWGKEAKARLEKKLPEAPIRVLLNTPPKDSKDRTLATLYVNDEDLGRYLIRNGLVMVYTVYPFSEMSAYLADQEVAKSKGVGLWAEAPVARRAALLQQEWRRQGK